MTKIASILSLPGKILGPDTLEIIVSIDEETKAVLLIVACLISALPVGLIWLGIIVKSIKFFIRSFK